MTAVGHRMRRLMAIGACTALPLTGCAWGGVNSLPLPGAPGRVAGASQFVVQMANVGSLESNSPVMLDDVVIGSVGAITVSDWHANVEVFVKPGVVVPANAVATVGQTSLLGSSHLALDPPPGAAPSGQLPPGTTLGLNDSSTYPSTEQTLAALSLVINGGGLGQIGDIVHSFNAAFSGRQADLRDLITRLDSFIGTFDEQRDNIVATIGALNKLTGTLATQRDMISDSLNKTAPALDVLVAERPRITTALDKLRVFSDAAHVVVSDVKDDLVTNLGHFEPTIRALADVGADIDKALAFATVFPYGQSAIDNAVKGDYINQVAAIDLTVPRLKRELLMGTRWGDPNSQLQAAEGDPGYAEQNGLPLAPGASAPVPAPNGQPGAPAPLPTAPTGPPPVGQPVAVPDLAPVDEGGR